MKDIIIRGVILITLIVFLVMFIGPISTAMYLSTKNAFILLSTVCYAVLFPFRKYR